MADFITIIPENTFRDTQRLLNEVNEIANAVERLNKQAQQVRFPSEARDVIQRTNSEIQRTNRVLSDNEVIRRRQQSAIRSLTVARSQENRTIQEQRVESTRLNRQQREEAILTSNLTGAYQRLNLTRTRASQRLRDLIASESASNREIARAQREFDRLNRRVRRANRAVRDFTSNVGNYTTAMQSAVKFTRQLVGAFGLLEAGRFLVNFTRDSIALAREARGVEFAFNRISNSAELLARTREATRGLLADLEIQRAAVQLSNFNLSVDDLDSLLQLATVRAIQTGQSVGQLVNQIVLGLGRQSVQRLDDLGISQQRINEEVAKGGTFMEAFVRIVEEELPKAGAVLDEAANSAQTFSAAVTNLQVAIGRLFEGRSGIGILTTQINRITTGFRLLNRGLDVFTRAIRQIVQDFPVFNRFVGRFSTMTSLFTTPGITVFSLVLIKISATLAGLSAATRVVVDDLVRLSNAFLLLTINPVRNITGFRNVLNSLKNIAGDVSEAFRGAYAAALEQNSRQTEANTKAAVSNTGALSGSIAALTKQIGVLRETRDNLALTAAQYQKFTDQITALEVAINRITGISTPETIGIVPIEPEDVDLISRAEDLLQKFFNVFERGRQGVEALQEETDAFLESFSVGFFSDAGLPALEQFFDGTFKRLIAGAETFRERFALTFNSIAEVAQQAFAFIDNVQQTQFQNQLRRLETERDIALEFAGDETAAKVEIQEQFEARRRELQQQQAEREKRVALFNIAINTAQAVVAALASVPPNIPLSITVGVIGALQAAIVSATPIPEFKHGVRDFEGGLAVVGDGGVPEVVRTPDNNIFMTPSKSTLVNLPKGADVYKNVRDFDLSLNKMLLSNKIEAQAGMSAKDFDRIMSKNMKGIQKFNLSMDKNGFSTWIGEQSKKREILNNIVRIKGDSV